ncbi:MAG: agmatine deiminase family protein [Candidatus Cloacimonetes bacterium]|nr:agmatine deiminase family protein [Candidatus Cloacimonadota bacterium]
MKPRIIIFLLCIVVFFFAAFLTQASEIPAVHKPPIVSRDSIIEKVKDPPPGYETVNPAEFGRSDGVILAWPGWGNEIIGDIAYAVADDYKVYMVVANSYYEGIATTYLSSVGVNMPNVNFIHDATMNNMGMWIRDYGPFCIHDEGAFAIDDLIWSGNYGIDLIPYTIADFFSLPIYHSNLIHHGGNHLTDGNGMGFFSTNIYNHNGGYTQNQIKQEFKAFFGIDSMVVFAPMNGDGTGHVDMFCKLLNDTLFIVGEYENPGASYPGDYELLNNLADYLGTLSSLDGRQFRVERIPMPPYYYGGPAGTINYTYTNSLIINDKGLVPLYGFDSDAEALQVYADCMPYHEIIPIDSEFIIQYWGAVHCITNELFSTNPLIVLHDPLKAYTSGTNPQIKFRLNPKFLQSGASVSYRCISSPNYTEIPALLKNGVWSATLPALTEDFSYYISGTATTGDIVFNTSLPEDAPSEVFWVDALNVGTDDEAGIYTIQLTNYPNPFKDDISISFSAPFAARSAYIKLFNVKGQVVRSYSITNQPTHTAEIKWDGKDDRGRSVESGTYFCSVVLDGKPVLTGRIIKIQ